MIVAIHSLGSLWQERSKGSADNLPPIIYNTTGIWDGEYWRPRSKVYGQVRLNHQARHELMRRDSLRRSAWQTEPISQHNGVHKLQLVERVRGPLTPDWFLVTVTDELVGRLNNESWDPSAAQLLSLSEWKNTQEAMLLLQPFSWLRGAEGAVVLIASGRGCHWKRTRW